MDIYCKKCGEPWEIYSLKHEVPDWDNQPDNPYEQLMKGKGCPSCNWGKNVRSISQKEKERREIEHYESLFNTDDDPVKYL